MTTGGHNAGILSEPGHPNRSYQMMTHSSGMPYISPDDWLKKATSEAGSWWTVWEDWLMKHSSPEKVAAPKVDTSLPEAPGIYVLQK